MVATIKFIVITTPLVRKGFVIKIEGLFGIITKSDKDVCMVKFSDDTEKEFSQEELRYCVVKFIAQMPDLNTFPISHGNFYDLVYHFNSKEKVKALDEGKIFNCKGSIQNVLSKIKQGNLVELISLKKAEAYKVLGSKEERVGIVVSVPTNPREKISIKLLKSEKVIPVDRTEVSILDDYNSTEIFKLDV